MKKLFLFFVLWCSVSAINAQCTSFKSNFGTLDSALNVKFYDSTNVATSATGVLYKVDWGDGNTNFYTSKPAFPVTHTYTSYGFYNVCYTVSGYNPNFCKDSFCRNITVCGNFNPTVVSTNAPTCNACNGTIYFTGLKPNSIIYLISHTKNGNVQTTPKTLSSNANGMVGVTGLCAGVYNNFYFGYNPNSYGCLYVYKAANINLTAANNISATFTKTSITNGSNGSMTVNPTGGSPQYTYLWSNNATTKTIGNLSAGIYCVTVTDSCGFFKTFCDSLNYNASACTGSPNQAFIYGADSICPGITAQYYASGFSLTQQGILAQWQYSADTINWFNISGANSNIYYYTATSGCNYIRMKVTCTNSQAVTYSNFKRVCVKTCSTSFPTCDSFKSFTYSINPNGVGTFTAMLPPSGHTINYFWKFSNGTTANTRIATTNFSNGSNYATLKICLLKNSAPVCCDSSTKYFVVQLGSNPCANVKAKFGYTANGATVNFKDSSTAPGMGMTYFWNFGDGTTSTLKDPTKTYANAGTYTVVLILSTYYNSGSVICKDTTYKIINVTAGNPCSKLIPSFTYTKNGNQFNFTNTSNYGGLTAVGVQWVFGDGTSSTQNNPTKTYSNNGNFNVILYVTAYDSATKSTCSKSYSVFISVFSNTCSGFDARYTYTKNYLTFNFTNTSVGLGTGTTYNWAFGDGATATTANASHTYALPGYYRVVLKMTTTFGNTTCTDSLVYYVYASSNNPCKDSGFVNNYNYNCGTYMSPVCGCDSVTYLNYCYAAKAGIKQMTYQPCPNDTNYVKICGYIYSDLNYNCVKDSADKGINSIQVNLSGTPANRTTYTDWNGYYQFFVPKGTYTVTQMLSQSYYYNTTLKVRQMCPGNNAGIVVNAPTGGNTYCNNNFYDTLKNCKDLAVYISKFHNVTPGFGRTLYLNYKNYSPFAVNNVKVYFKKNTVQNFVSSTPAASGSSGNNYYWNIGTLAANQSGQIKIELFTPVGTAIGTITRDSAWIVPDSGDCELANNMSALKDECKSSWDPNDKAVSPTGEGAIGGITRDVRTLDYLVRFQNKGNAPAYNVRVEDQLSANFDWTTLRLNSTSHPVVVSIEDGGNLIFEFQNILLPDDKTDEEGSQGYINYSIDMKDNLNYGTEFKNTASIYFDFNEPVITNMTLNTLVEKTSGISAIDGNHLQVRLYPNPIQSVANFNFTSEKEEAISIVITDLTGKTLSTNQVNIKVGTQLVSIPTEQLQSGLYIVNIKNNVQNLQTIKVIKE